MASTSPTNGPGWPSATFAQPALYSFAEPDHVILQKVATGSILVHAVSWNMHGKQPPADLSSLLPPNAAHIYAIGSEECERSIAQSLVIAGKERWEARLAASLGPAYVRLASHTLAAIHLAVFVHCALVPIVSDVQTGAVSCGVGNALGNKGGVAVGFSVGKTSFLFINAHLAAHTRAVARRNADAARIDALLPLCPSGLRTDMQVETRLELSPTSSAITSSCVDGIGVQSRATGPRGSTATLGSIDADDPDSDEEEEAIASTPRESEDGSGTSAQDFSTRSHASALPGEHPLPAAGTAGVCSRYDRIVWMGDLNYRIHGSRSAIDSLLQTGSHEVLLANDQLLRERRAGRAFQGFAEGPLLFRPTYKLNKGTLTYDNGPKARVPAWTDRILFRSSADGPEAGEGAGGALTVSGKYEYPATPVVSRVDARRDSRSDAQVVDLHAGPGPAPLIAVPGMLLLSYTCVDTLRTSDHLPVSALFEVRLRGAHARRKSTASIPVQQISAGSDSGAERVRGTSVTSVPVLPASVSGTGSGSVRENNTHSATTSDVDMQHVPGQQKVFVASGRRISFREEIGLGAQTLGAQGLQPPLPIITARGLLDDTPIARAPLPVSFVSSVSEASFANGQGKKPQAQAQVKTHGPHVPLLRLPSQPEAHGTDALHHHHHPPHVPTPAHGHRHGPGPAHIVIAQFGCWGQSSPGPLSAKVAPAPIASLSLSSSASSAHLAEGAAGVHSRKSPALQAHALHTPLQRMRNKGLGSTTTHVCGVQ